jgi:hypothetical protein
MREDIAAKESPLFAIGKEAQRCIFGNSSSTPCNGYLGHPFKNMHFEKEKDLPPLVLPTYAMRAIPPCGRQDPVAGCPFRSGVERERLLTQVQRAGGACSSLFPRKRRGFAREARWRNPRVSVLLSPTLTLFLAPHGKLYLKLQELVPESESVRLAASPPPKTMASSIEIPDATLPATDFSNGYPK